MASAESIAIRCDKALATLEAELSRLGVKVAPIPRLNRDKIMLRAIQLEALLAYVQQVQKPESLPVTAKRKPRKPRQQKART